MSGYGKLPGEVNEEVRRKAIGDDEVITVRPADLIAPELEKYKEETNTFEEYNNLNKKTLEGVNNILDDTAEWISNLENRMVKITQSDQQKGKYKKIKIKIA